MRAIGLADGICALVTFKNKKTLEVGCSYYLLGSPVNPLFMVMVLVLKSSLLYASQTESLTNRPFRRVQCATMEFFLRLYLNMDQWLNAAIASERTIEE